jgi:hypothetical protein
MVASFGRSVAVEHRGRRLALRAIAKIGVISAIFAAVGYSAENRGGLSGTWQLVSWTDTSDGVKPYFPFGMNPVGQFLFTGDGHFSVQVQCDSQGAVPGAPPPDALEDSQAPYLGYFGTYSADTANGTISYRVLGANVSFVYGDESRIFRFDGDRLIITGQWTAPHGRRWNSEEVLVRAHAHE